MLVLLFFFFSSRRRHTKWTGDWSSDVCSSDLIITGHAGRFMRNDRRLGSRLANKLNRLTQTIVIEFVVRKKVARHVCCQSICVQSIVRPTAIGGPRGNAHKDQNSSGRDKLGRILPLLE